ncbi:hypothetical protein FB45DRAFT_935832, partial [Roridomyces roridus]
MLPKESGGVVDTTLMVYGTKNVRVVDVSIVPLHVSENAADIIKAAHAAVVNTTISSDPSDSGSGSDESGSTGSAGDAAKTNASTRSTSTKVIIGAASGVAALVLLGFLVFFCRRRNHAKQARASAFGKDDAWLRRMIMDGTRTSHEHPSWPRAQARIVGIRCRLRLVWIRCTRRISKRCSTITAGSTMGSTRGWGCMILGMLQRRRMAHCIRICRRRMLWRCIRPPRPRRRMRALG